MTDPMTPEIEALLERLRKVETTGRFGDSSYTTNWHRNPEGPEAADTIERLYMLAKANNGLARMVTGQRDEQGAELRDTIARLTAELAMKDEALAHTARIFRKYEQMHLAKATDEGRDKAERNRDAAEVCEAALTPADEREIG